MLRSLVGSEMCVRDRSTTAWWRWMRIPTRMPSWRACLLYTSDAADERSSVDLGGRRIIKKKKKNFFFFFQAEDGIRDAQESRGLGDVCKRQKHNRMVALDAHPDKDAVMAS